ncbi:MAG: efflux RND transporter periplasmic adaptor subunit [Phycisphaerales bacterium]
MRIKKSIIAVLILVIAVVWYVERRMTAPNSNDASIKNIYYCPMHPTFTSGKPGLCSICGMSLIKKQQASPVEHSQDKNKPSSQRKILYYRNPMNPNVTSPVPMKDEMGMDYVPVYEDKSESGESVTGKIKISPQKQQLIGVKTEKIKMQPLEGQILTVGIVAYDPDLFVAQQEYLQSLQTRKTMESGSLKYSDEQLSLIVNASKRKLILLGMSEAEISQLEKSGKPQQYLYLPQDGKVWVYITIYEYEMGLVEPNQPVQVQTAAYPGKFFEGEIISAAPILGKQTRTLKVRAIVNDSAGELKPEMYVDVKINYNLGEKLVVPADAILNSGTKKIVFIAKPDGYFQPRQIDLGHKAGNFYEVLKGLSENDTVVTSGNFLIDSESKLNTVLGQMSDQNSTENKVHTGH